MKRLFTILITLTLLLGLTACGQVETQSNPGQSQTQQEGTSSKEESSTPNQSTPPAFSTPEAGESDVETPEDGVERSPFFEYFYRKTDFSFLESLVVSRLSLFIFWMVHFKNPQMEKYYFHSMTLFEHPFSIKLA